MEAAFLEMVTEHQRIIHKVCLLYRNGKEDQEDLFQEIVYQLWKSFKSFKGEAKISSWMYKIALNTALASFRKKKVDMHFVATFSEQQLNEYQQERNPQAQALWEAIKQLNDAEKALVSLYLEGFHYDEIAEISGITENYVGVKLNRIKKKLKKLLKQ